MTLPQGARSNLIPGSQSLSHLNDKLKEDEEINDNEP
jgi:hypothetical protein